VIIFLMYLLTYLYTILKLSSVKYFEYSKNYFWIQITFASLLVGFIFSSIGPSTLMECEWLWPLMAISMKVSSITNES
jgi:hypothetical protein